MSTTSIFGGAGVQALACSADTLKREPAFPLSFAQQRLWFMEQLQPGTAAYSLPIAWRIEGPLDVAAFERSLNEMLRRHASLRTTFSTANTCQTSTHVRESLADSNGVREGEARQIVRPFQPVQLPIVDLSSSADPGAEARRWMNSEAAKPFDLEQGPLFRAQMLRLGDERHIAFFNAHHIVWDGWSLDLFRREMAALYDTFVAGQPSPLPELPMQYTDFAAWQRDRAHGPVWDEQLAYWRQQLRGPLPALELPADHPRPAVQTSRGATEFCEFDAALVKELRALGRKQGATLFMTLLAAFKTLLHRYTGGDDILVGSPITGRDHVDAGSLIGFFVNTLALRTDFSGDPTFVELLQRVKNVTLDAYAHQEMPFDRIVQEVQPERSLAEHAPLIQAVIGFESGLTREWPLGAARAGLLELEATTSKFDWTFCWRKPMAG